MVLVINQELPEWERLNPKAGPPVEALGVIMRNVAERFHPMFIRSKSMFSGRKGDHIRKGMACKFLKTQDNDFMASETNLPGMAPFSHPHEYRPKAV